jgi:hypothetical protein
MPKLTPLYIPTQAEIAEATRRIRQRWSEAEYRYRYYCPNLDRPRADVLADLADAAAPSLPELPDPRK